MPHAWDELFHGKAEAHRMQLEREATRLADEVRRGNEAARERSIAAQDYAHAQAAHARELAETVRDEQRETQRLIREQTAEAQRLARRSEPTTPAMLRQSGLEAHAAELLTVGQMDDFVDRRERARLNADARTEALLREAFLRSTLTPAEALAADLPVGMTGAIAEARLMERGAAATAAWALLEGDEPALNPRMLAIIAGCLLGAVGTVALLGWWVTSLAVICAVGQMEKTEDTSFLAALGVAVLSAAQRFFIGTGSDHLVGTLILAACVLAGFGLVCLKWWRQVDQARRARAEARTLVAAYKERERVISEELRAVSLGVHPTVDSLEYGSPYVFTAVNLSRVNVGGLFRHLAHFAYARAAVRSALARWTAVRPAWRLALPEDHQAVEDQAMASFDPWWAKGLGREDPPRTQPEAFADTVQFPDVPPSARRAVGA